MTLLQLPTESGDIFVNRENIIAIKSSFDPLSANAVRSIIYLNSVTNPRILCLLEVEEVIHLTNASVIAHK